MSVCCFIGKSRCSFSEEDIKRLKDTIEDLIHQGVDTFYNGKKGDFDCECAKAVYDLKKKYNFIRNIKVIAYYSFKKEEGAIDYLFDESYYPSLEKVPYRYRYIERNKWMIRNSDFLICRVSSLGSSCGIKEYAQRRENITIIDI